MRGRQAVFAVICLLLAAHLALLIIGAFIPSAPRLPSLISSYEDETGIGTSFGFFAPNIPPLVVGTVKIREENGVRRKFTLNNTASEQAIRLSAMMLLFREYHYMDLSARMVAAYEFNNDPNAKLISVEFTNYVIPTMAGYVKGARPRADLIVRDAFAVAR